MGVEFLIVATAIHRLKRGPGQAREAESGRCLGELLRRRLDWLQRLQKCNELLALFGLEIQPKDMARNSSHVRAEWPKSAGNMSFSEPVWIEHLFQARH